MDDAKGKGKQKKFRHVKKAQNPLIIVKKPKSIFKPMEIAKFITSI